MSLVTVARLDAVVLRVRDLDRSVQWYSNILGLTPAHRDDATGIAILHLEGAPLTLLRTSELQSDEPSRRTGDSAARGAALTPHLSAFPIFAVNDAHAAHAALTEAGVEVSTLHEDLSVRWCEFADPDGNRLEVCESVV